MVEFTQEIFDTICERLAEGESLRSICRDETMPSIVSFWRWTGQSEDLSKQYAKARETQADANADEINDIAMRTLHGEFEPKAARVAIDALKWTASKLRPKAYGDKLDLTHGNPDGSALSFVVRDMTKDD